MAIGLVILMGTIVLAALAQLVNHGSDARLLHLQVRQAATVLTAAVPEIQTEMNDGLHVAEATGSPAAFTRFMSSPDAPRHFASVSLWRRSGSTVSMEALVGSAPNLVADGRARSFLGAAGPSPQLHVTGILAGPHGERIGFADRPPGDRNLIVYAESALPASKRVALPRSSAFGDLNFALYLGPAASPSQLIESSVPLPIRGLTASSSLAFGDTSITVVGTPTANLAGGLSAALPWIVLSAGVVFAGASMVLAEYVQRRRAHAETLASENERLYLEQRRIASDFQHALLPALPEVDGMELGARYIAGTTGLDVGGDWYDVIQTGPRSCTFVVGDVSGHGLRAATTMAALRFATRAYVADAGEPSVLLERLGRLQELDDETFATVLAGTIDLDRGTMTVASAGHPPPLLLDGSGTRYVPVKATTPIGIGRPAPEALTVPVPPGTLVVAYTDGLVERPGESIDDGLERLRTVEVPAGASIETILDLLVERLVPTGAGDDTALLALRWIRPEPGA